MGGKSRTVVCVKKVKKGMPEEDWDESMPLPGDIIEGVVGEEEEPAETPPPRPPLIPARGRSELSSQLARINRRMSGSVCVRVRRGDDVLDLRARVAPDPERDSKLHRRFTIRAARDDRHVALLGDLSLDQVSELQETSRRVVNVENNRFHTRGVEYDWKQKVGSNLPDRSSTVISSMVFIPFHNERTVHATITRSMAWFSAAASTGVPLVFVNIQTDQLISLDKATSTGGTNVYTSWRDMNRCRQQIPKTAFEMVRGIRLWFLPGIAELPIVLAIKPGETRFGMDIKRTEEGFICIGSASKGSAADRSGLRKLCIEARDDGYLVVISQLQGSSIVPSAVTSDGRIHSCDHADIKDRLHVAINRMEDVHLRIMVWPKQISGNPSLQMQGPATLLPPTNYSNSRFTQTTDRQFEEGSMDRFLRPKRYFLTVTMSLVMCITHLE